jgi:hypothetical protein
LGKHWELFLEEVAAEVDTVAEVSVGGPVEVAVRAVVGRHFIPSILALVIAGD